MASRRTISYIGLWALIMPWLGFSWGTKTVLFSLTGILLLVIGNRHYHSNKSKQKEFLNNPEIKPEEKPVVKTETVKIPEVQKPVYKDVPEYMSPIPATKNTYEHREPKIEEKTEELLNDFDYKKEESIDEIVSIVPEIKEEAVQNDFIQKPKSKLRRKIEMSPRAIRTTPKPISLDSLNSEENYEQNEL